MTLTDQEPVNANNEKSAFAEEEVVEEAKGNEKTQVHKLEGDKQERQKQAFSKLQTDIALFEKIILKEKNYTKIAVKLNMISAFTEFLKILQSSLTLIKSKDSVTVEDQSLFNQIQAISLDLMLSVFVLSQFLYQIKLAYGEDALKKDPKKDDPKRQTNYENKIKEYAQKINHSDIISICSRFVELQLELAKRAAEINAKNDALASLENN